jgi:hypothetical protein
LRHYRFFVPLVAASRVSFPRFAVISGLCLIILFLVLVTPIAHAFWARADRKQRISDLKDFSKNMGLLGGSVMMLLISEPWPYSLGSVGFMRRINPHGPHLVPPS